jgi:hypothetical protein
MSKVTELLEGSSKIRLETTIGDKEYKLLNEDTVEVPGETPDFIISHLKNNDYSVEVAFEPQFHTTYVHDETLSYGRKEIADKLGLDEDHRIVNAIADYSYEISLKFDVEDLETCKLVSINGNELKEPPNLV